MSCRCGFRSPWRSVAHRVLTFSVPVPVDPCSMTTELRARQLRLGDAETQLARRVEEAQVRDWRRVACRWTAQTCMLFWKAGQHIVSLGWASMCPSSCCTRWPKL